MKSKSSRRTKAAEQLFNFTPYVRRLNKIMNPDLMLSKEVTVTLNDFMADIFYQISTEAGSLNQRMHQKTLTDKDIEAAIKLVLPPNLVTYAIHEAKKAVIISNNYRRTFTTECYDV